MENKIIDLTEKKEIKSIKSKEKIAKHPELIFTIEFDGDDKMIIDLELLEKIISRVCDELKKKTIKNIGMDLIAMLMAMGGIDNKELKEILKDMK